MSNPFYRRTHYGSVSVTPLGVVAAIAATIAFFVFATLSAMDGMTGADVAAMERRGCPEGYQPITTTGFALGQPVYMTQCVEVRK